MLFSYYVLHNRKIRVVHDPVTCGCYDRVMPVFEDESLFLGQFLSNSDGKKVLDLGTGSGILGVLSAPKAEHITGVDINPKAIRYARETSRLHKVENKCTFLKGDLYGPVKNQKFDLIICNPPFVPIPFGYKMFLSADGGPDGLKLVRRTLNGINNHMTLDGKLILLTMSLGNEIDPLMFKYLYKTFEHRNIKITTTHIYEKERIDAEPFFRLFKDIPTYSEWRRFLKKHKLTHLYYMIHKVEPSASFEHIIKYNKIPFKKSQFSGSWAGRLNRFKTWFEKIPDNTLTNRILSKNVSIR